MTAEMSTCRRDSTAKVSVEQNLLEANRIVDEVKRCWRGGETPDVVGVLARHPELRQFRSVVLDLAYTEYRLRLEAGESVDAEAFAKRYPSLQKSLYLLIEVHSLLSQDPELRSLQEVVSWPESGDRFLQYHLLGEVGRGAFGRVFLATEPAIGDREVVVKVTPYGGGEAEILGKLWHPNIVPVYSLQQDPDSGLTALCMPYLGRATLCDVLDQSFLDGSAPAKAQAILDAVAVANVGYGVQAQSPPALILRRGSYVNGVIHLAGQLADAMAHAHGRGICHRDLKPSNVLMTADGRPLLLDFNLSVETAAPAWKVGGTLPYMPPEELANLVRSKSDARPLHYDPRSDVFSLGVIVFELLTGKLPFGAIPHNCAWDEAARQLHQQQTQGPQSIRGLNRGVDPRLAQLVESCLAFEPRQRPETARQLAAALRRELSLTRRCRRWAGSHRALVSASSLAILTIATLVVAFLAIRPPYSVRQFQAGLRLLDRGEYSSAIDLFDNSIRSDPKSSEALFARARAYHRMGQFQSAFHDYDLAGQLAPSPLYGACKGYCCSRMKLHDNAVALCTSALEAGYDRPALLYNNIGVSYLALGDLDKSEESLRRAIRIDDRLQAAHFNIAVLYLRRAVRGQSIPKDALTFVRKAVERNPATADLHRVAGALYAIAARKDATLIQPAIEHVKKAVELGYDPKAFASDSSYSALQREPSFHDALRSRALASGPTKAVQLLDPLDYF